MTDSYFSSTLQHVVAAYLISKGCRMYHDHGQERWRHPELGSGRTFFQAVEWVIGCEQTGRVLV